MDNLILVALLVTTGAIVGASAATSYYESSSIGPLIDQCEAELPRNQSCVLIAVPKEKSNE